MLASNHLRQLLVGCLLLGAIPWAAPIGRAQSPEVPAPLQPWQEWATWDLPHRDCPTPYHNADEHFCFWPATLSLAAVPSRHTVLSSGTRYSHLPLRRLS